MLSASRSFCQKGWGAIKHMVSKKDEVTKIINIFPISEGLNEANF